MSRAFASRLALALAAPIAASGAGAAIIGRTVPAPPLTAERLDQVPAAERGAWTAYLARSAAARKLDEDALARERGQAPEPPPPPTGAAAASMPLDRPHAWYATPEARHVADVIVSFQTPAGGWGKNSPRSGAVRQPGQAFSAEPAYVGTLDNDATVTELRFLARVIAQAPPGQSTLYRQSFSRGVRYLLDAQFPNGGWPQVWPLVGGYHDAVTFNDGAMLAATRFLGEAAKGQGDYAWVEPGLRRAAHLASTRALAGLLAAQVVVDGEPAGWAQQSDTLTLQPVGARNFEPRSLASAESAEILDYLMTLPDPSPATARAIHGAAAWLAKAALADKAWVPGEAGAARRLVDQPGAPPLWARFYDIETGRPIFGDRDLTTHDDVHDLTAERRNGYAWFTPAPAKVLARYADWARAHPKR